MVFVCCFSKNGFKSSKIPKTENLGSKNDPFLAIFGVFCTFFHFLHEKTFFENRRFFKNPEKSEKKGVFSRFSVFFSIFLIFLIFNFFNFRHFWCFLSFLPQENDIFFHFENFIFFQKKVKKSDFPHEPFFLVKEPGAKKPVFRYPKNRVFLTFFWRFFEKFAPGSLAFLKSSKNH